MEIAKLSSMHPLLVVGLPGMGMVGASAANFLIENSTRSVISHLIYPFELRRLISSTSNGFLRDNSIKLHSVSIPEFSYDLFVLTGAAQPSYNLTQYLLAYNTLRIVKNFGCEYVITLGGYQTTSPERRRVFFTTNDVTLFHIAESLGLHTFGGTVTGAAGLFVGISPLLNLKSICLLCETLGIYSDSEASTTILSHFYRLISRLSPSPSP